MDGRSSIMQNLYKRRNISTERNAHCIHYHASYTIVPSFEAYPGTPAPALYFLLSLSFRSVFTDNDFSALYLLSFYNIHSIQYILQEKLNRFPERAHVISSMSLPNESPRASLRPTGPGLGQLLYEFNTVSNELWIAEHHLHRCTYQIERHRFESNLRLIWKSACEMKTALIERRLLELAENTSIQPSAGERHLNSVTAAELRQELARVNSILDGFTAATERELERHRVITQLHLRLIGKVAERHVSYDLSCLYYTITKHF
jgi:hypothetical protein